MKHCTAIALLLFAVVVLVAASFAQQNQDEKQDQAQSAKSRKIVNRVVPVYPDIARRMHLNGVVKVEAEVASNGTVKNVSLRGGHPILAEAAMEAVRKWKWVPTPHETEEPIEVRFEGDK